MTEVHPDYGPLYRFSDHKIGDHITYRSEGRTHTGEILWVCTESVLPRSGRFPPHYLVIADGGSFPESVFFGDVVMD
jgi:hypothetical protein